MIRLLLRESGAVYLIALTALLAALSWTWASVTLTFPLMPRGIPGSWLVAVASIMVGAYLLRARWDRAFRRLPRSRRTRAVACVAAGLLGAIAYLPAQWASPDRAELTLWLALGSIAIWSINFGGELYWAPIVGCGVVVEGLNNVLGDAFKNELQYTWFSLAGPALVVMAAGVALYVWRGPTQWAE